MKSKNRSETNFPRQKTDNHSHNFIWVIIPSIFLIDWFEENVINPRIWKDWSCEEMRKFALTFEDEKLTDFQRARFHEDLSLCLR